MAWLSAGDLVSASVSGSTYGYALMWALVLALFARFFFVSAADLIDILSKGGEPKAPGWYHNLKANPQVRFAAAGKSRLSGKRYNSRAGTASSSANATCRRT